MPTTTPRIPVDRRLRRAAGRARRLLNLTLAAAGVRQSDAKLTADAQQYWNGAANDRWRSYSHWRSGSAFANTTIWSDIGDRHLAMFERGARAAQFERPWGRMLEWGCGGGANAVRFAPHATEFVGVEVSAESLRECAHQVHTSCDTPFKPVLIDVAHPEAALGAGECDVFLCFYVFELLPSPEYGQRILRIARQLLRPGGLALIQIKYDTGQWATRPRRRAYCTAVADMTTYPLHAFWELSLTCGFAPCPSNWFPATPSTSGTPTSCSPKLDLQPVRLWCCSRVRMP